MNAVVLVCLGAAVGAPARYLLDRAIQALHDTVFPFGTLSINVAGSLVLGLLVGVGARPDGTTYLALGTGFCGAFTTYSTFGYETVRLLERGAWRQAALNVLASTCGALAAALAGLALGSWVA
jgi:CrcB protein